MSALNPQLVPIFESLSAEIVARAPDVKCEFGRQRINEHSAPPRIVWVPSEDEYIAPVKPQGRSQNEATTVYTKRAGVEIHMWGADDTAAEEINRLFIEVAWRKLGAAFEIKGGTWDPTSDVSIDGIEYTLLIALRLPVTLSPDATVTVTDWPITKKTMVTP